MSNSAHLTSRSLIAIGGDEATGFLQNLVTCDVENLADGMASFGALLTPQGKILFDFLLYRSGDGLLIDVSAEQAADLAKRLMFYRLRAKVDIEALDEEVHVVWPADCNRFTDPRDSRLGSRIVGSAESASSEADWDSHRIKLGFPECGNDFEASTVFPHEALMDHFGHSGVDFSKGCYVGQEVVSRMQHRGTARSRFVRVAAEDDAKLPTAGTEVKAGEKTIGKMGSHAGSNGLALLRLDRTAAAMADGQEITVADIAVTPTLPDFATFDWPQ